MPIVTLSWQGNVAYGPRGTRYELASVAGLNEVRVYSPEQPGGQQIAREGTREEAMLAAQRHCEGLTEAIGAEAEALATAGRTQVRR